MAKQACIRMTRASEVIHLLNTLPITAFTYFRHSYSSGVMTQFVFEFEGHADDFRFRCDELWTQWTAKQCRKLDENAFIEWLKPRVIAYIETHPEEEFMVDGDPPQGKLF